ncbi:MAG: hypothetical protein IJS42_01560, partial [Synergistaceae bacterium]|nr:hypothetical protein [Synergistaceae bacterium]
MKKLLCWVTAAAFLAFIAASLGGCGGSSSNKFTGGGGTSEEKSAEEKLAGELSGDMASVYGKDEYTKMYDEFRESGSFDKMNPMKWVFCIPEDRAEEMLEEEENELARALLQELLFDADSIKEAYDKEETILLFYPDESFINRTLDAVGLVGNYVLTPEEAPDGRLELFAVAKRTVNDRTHTFTYHAACSDAFTISDDLSAPSTEG